MLSTILVLIVMAAVIYGGTYIAKHVLGQRDVILFQDFPRVEVPYITIDVQGIPLNMIVDTGCSVSVMIKKAIDKLNYEESKRKVNLNALTPESIDSKVFSVPITIGGKTIKTDFATIDQEELGFFGMKYGITIHGLLGAEFFASTKCKIDFNTNSLIVS